MGKMRQIQIGTCVPGDRAAEWLPHLIKAGFETVSLNFHMSLGGVDLKELSKQVNEIIGDSGVRISTLGLYCNPIQYEEHKKALEYCIENAGLFGAGIVSRITSYNVCYTKLLR